MVLRIFRARVVPGRVGDFKKLVQEQSIPWLQQTDGMLGYFAGAPLAGNEREFTMVTLWRDLDALRAFCGEDWSQPLVTEEEEPLVEAMFADHYLRFDQ